MLICCYECIREREERERWGNPLEESSWGFRGESPCCRISLQPGSPALFPWKLALHNRRQRRKLRMVGKRKEVGGREGMRFRWWLSTEPTCRIHEACGEHRQQREGHMTARAFLMTLHHEHALTSQTGGSGSLLLIYCHGGGLEGRKERGVKPAIFYSRCQ